MSTMLRISPLSNLQTHTRFKVVLRNENTNEYKDLILFRLAPSTSDSSNQIYAMQSTCPHLGADLSFADIEDFSDTDSSSNLVIVCPWHRYDFDIRTGESETGMNACTYRVETRRVEDASEIVYLESPSKEPGWSLVELNGVSEAFADPPPPSQTSTIIQFPTRETPIEPMIPSTEPKTLVEWAVLILNTSDPALKVARTRHASTLFQTGTLTRLGERSLDTRYQPPQPPLIPPRSEKPHVKSPSIPQIVGIKSRLSALHALANIEQWAIDLAWDIIARYIPAANEWPEQQQQCACGETMPLAFYRDFVKVAQDEAKHFSLLAWRIETMSQGHIVYGDGTFPVHAALWESALETKNSLLSRLAIIHMVHEARGLDVNPQTIERFKRTRDSESVKVLETIHYDEITHVTAGHRWFTYLCSQAVPPLNPIKQFRLEVKRHWKGDIKGPFNEKDRATAGLAKDFYEDLKGEMEMVDSRVMKGLATLDVAGVH